MVTPTGMYCQEKMKLNLRSRGREPRGIAPQSWGVEGPPPPNTCHNIGSSFLEYLGTPRKQCGVATHTGMCTTPNVCTIPIMGIVNISVMYVVLVLVMGRGSLYELITVLHKDGHKGSTKSLPRDMFYEDHFSPGTLEARADGTICTVQFPVFSTGQWAVTRTVQLKALPRRVLVNDDRARTISSDIFWDLT